MWKWCGKWKGGKKTWIYLLPFPSADSGWPGGKWEGEQEWGLSRTTPWGQLHQQVPLSPWGCHLGPLLRVVLRPLQVNWGCVMLFWMCRVMCCCCCCSLVWPNSPETNWPKPGRYLSSHIKDPLRYSEICLWEGSGRRDYWLTGIAPLGPTDPSTTVPSLAVPPKQEISSAPRMSRSKRDRV